MLDYEILAERQSDKGCVAIGKCAQVQLDTCLAGCEDAFNPAELLLTPLLACMLKGIERVTPILKSAFHHAAVRIHGWRQDNPRRMTRIEYVLWVDTDEPERRLELLHENLRKYGTIYNTVAAACALSGEIRRGRPQ